MMMNNYQPDYGAKARQIPIFGQIWVNGLRRRLFPDAPYMPRWNCLPTNIILFGLFFLKIKSLKTDYRWGRKLILKQERKG